MKVVLPHGRWADGSCLREVEVRPLRGEDETLLAETGGTTAAAERTTLVLARSAGETGSGDPLGETAVRSLTVGDREALLLHLRRLTFGDRMACVLACPEPGCGERLDMDLSVGDLLVDPYTDSRERYEARIGRYRVSFRLPTGDDQEAVAPTAMDDPETAVSLVLKRCVEEVLGGRAAASLPLAVARKLPAIMAELDPQAELRLDLSCPVCGTRFDVPFDTGDFLFRELAVHAAGLEREVHLLALHYHWSEPEILALPHRKRQRYLELLADAVGTGRPS